MKKALPGKTEIAAERILSGMIARCKKPAQAAGIGLRADGYESRYYMKL